MKKEDVFNFVNECENCNEKPYGYFVVAISREDIAAKFGDLVRKFDMFTEEEKANILSEMADVLNDVYENEHFGNDFRKAFNDIIND